jgi:hypothetical protein
VTSTPEIEDLAAVAAALQAALSPALFAESDGEVGARAIASRWKMLARSEGLH